MSRRAVLAGAVAVVSLVWLSVVPFSAQTITRVRDIVSDRMNYVNVQVTVEGFATQWTEGRGSTNFYILKDDWGYTIKVRTSKERPIVGERYRVTGVCGIDVVNRNDVYVSEEVRVEVRPVVPAAPAPVAVAPPGEEKAPQEVPWLLVVAAVVALVVLVALLMWLLRSRDRSTEATVQPSVADFGPAGAGLEGPPQIVEGRTIKMHAPPPGTLKILPGRFEVVAGDETVKEIRFYRVKGQSTPEVTFGRAAGAPYSHIQLKPMTVSSRQAKMTYINNQWILTNFAPDTSNPTRVNGHELPVDGQVALKEGDRVAMGEVEFVFHAG